MQAKLGASVLFISFFQFSFVLISATPKLPDQVPLITILYSQRNVTIYTSASNPSREPKEWLFWYDPLFIFNASKDIFQFNEQMRFEFSLASTEVEQIARKTIVTKMHPDVERFVLFWIIEPLPIDTLTIYVVDQVSLPIPAAYPCTKTNLSGILTYECQFQCSSMLIANAITQNFLCGKIKLQLEYYIQSAANPVTVPPRLATTFNLHSLRSIFGVAKYVHLRQEQQFIEKYFLKIQSIDDTVKESELQHLFSLAVNTTTRYEINQFQNLWQSEDLESIINHDLFYVRFHKNNQVSFSLRSTESPWALTSADKQTFHQDEIQQMFLNQLQMTVEWSSSEKRWKIQSLIVHSLADILDTLQLSLITKQYDIDKINATSQRTIDCADWSATCACQSASSAVVFITNTQFIRIPSIDMNFTVTGFTIQIRVRPNSLPKNNKPVQLINFRGEYLVAYQPKGEITFSIVDPAHPHLYTTTLQAIPLDQWTHLSFVFLAIESQLQLYVNGEFVSSIILSIPSQQITDDIIIGKGFIGAVRDLRLWGCARNPDDIRFTVQLATLMGNETCLVGFWPMTDAAGETVQDTIFNGTPHPGTLGFDDNPNLLNSPIWAYVLPTPPPPPPPRILTYQVFRENITFPMIAQWGTIFDVAVPADYDGDGFADFAVYRRPTLTWMVSSSNNPNILLTKFWGLPGDIPVRCNFDGDKFFDFTVFRPSTAHWISHLSSNPDFQYIQQWGKPGDVPCPGDFDGDGKTDFVVYRKGFYYINPSLNPTVQWTKQWGQPGDVCVSNCDFDRDGRTDFTVWTPTTSIWSWIPSSSPWLIYQRQWGSRYDTPLCADFDGDGRKDFVVYRNWTGEWFIIPYRVSSFLITFQWGLPNDIPVAGDYDGDGRSEFGLWRPRTNRTYVWEIIPSTMPVALLRKAWGFAGDQVVIGDFDADKRSDFTVWRPTSGFWYVLFIGKPGVQLIKHWGFTVNDTAVAGDWDGDLFTDFTIYRPTTGYWYIMLAKNPILQIFMQWGVPLYNDVAVPGDFDGDSKYDFAVWRPTTGMWFILPSTNPSTVIMTQWGLYGDIPVTGADFDGDGKTDVAVWRPSTGSWYVQPSSNPVYPFFGPFIIKQPFVSLPPLAGAVPPSAGAAVSGAAASAAASGVPPAAAAGAAAAAAVNSGAPPAAAAGAAAAGAASGSAPVPG